MLNAPTTAADTKAYLQKQPEEAVAKIQAPIKFKDSGGGYIAKRMDAQNLDTLEKVVKGLRLDYEGSPFIDADGNLLTDSYVRIEFNTPETDYIDIPYGNRDGTNLDPDPASGNGFIKSDEYTVPEYKVDNPTNTNATIGLKKGSKMFLNIDGEEVLVGIADDDGLFKYVEE